MRWTDQLVAEKIFAIVGKTPRIITDTQRVRPEKSEVMTLLASNAKAKALMGWTPKVTLDEGLKQTVAWIREHLDAYRPDEYTV